MSTTENTAKTRPARTGLFATLSSSLCAKGSGAPSAASAPRALALAIAALAAMVLAAPAGASGVHPYLSTPLSHSGYTSACGTAVDSHGDLYVTNVVSGNTTITVYDHSGATLTSFGVTGSVCHLAVDSSGNLYANTLNKAVTKYKPSEYPPVATPSPTTYALDASINETSPGANNGDGVIDAHPSKSVAVDPATQDVFVARMPVAEQQTVTFTSFLAGDTFKIGNLPAQCSASETDPITYAESSTGANAIRDAIRAKCGGTANLANNVGNPPTSTVVFKGALAGIDFAQMTCTQLSGTGTCTFGPTATVDGVPSEIAQFHSNGALVTAAIGSGLAGANYVGVDVYATNGRIYAFDAAHGQIAIFNPGSANPNSTINGSATPAGSIGAAFNGTGLAVDQATGHVYAYDGVHNVVDEFKPSGAYVTQLTDSLVTPSLTTDVAIDNSGGANDGDIYVADKTLVQAFGVLQHPYLSTPLSHSGYTSACGTAVDSHGDLYVTNVVSGNTTITVYDHSGATLTSFGVTGSVCHLAVDSSGNLYANTLNKAVTKYKPSEYPPVATPSPTTYALDASINETSPGANNGDGVIDAHPSKSVAVDPATQDVFVARMPVAEQQTVTFTSFLAGDTFKIGNLPAQCSASETDPITYAESSTGANAIRDAIRAKCGGTANLANNVGNPPTSTVVFKGALAGIDFAQMTCTQLSGTGTCTFGPTATVDGVPSEIAQFHSNGALVTAAIGSGLAGANYVGVDVYATNGRIYAFDAAHGQIAIFNPGSANPNSTINGSATPAGSIGAAFNGTGLAVDQATGHVYAYDGVHNVVDEFKPSGAYVTQLTDSLVTPSLTTDVAIDNSGGANDGDIYVADKTLVQAWGQMSYDDQLTLSVLRNGTGFGAVAGGSTATPNAIDCGSTCDANFDPGTEVTLVATADPGSTFASWSGCDSLSTTTIADDTCTVTINANTAVTATFIKRTLSVTKSGPGSGSLSSDPAGIDCGTTCTGNFDDGQEVVLTPHAATGSKIKTWTGCDSVSGDQCTVTMNSDKSVNAEFALEPTISATAASGVSTTNATLNAKVNPNGYLTTWHFEYVDDATYQADQPDGFAHATKAPASDFSAGAGSGDVAVSRAITGLADATLYHFRLVATNFASPAQGTPGAEGTFFTYLAPPPPEPCDNDSLRTGHGADLPDCRAYEQASPVDKNGQDARGGGDIMAAASTGDAVIYYSQNGMPGGVGPQGSPFYIARRGGGQWSAQGLLPPAALGNKSTPRGWTADLSSVFLGTISQDTGLQSLYERSSADGSLTQVSGAGRPIFVGSSEDGSLDYFSPSDDSAFVPLAPGAVAGVPNVYAWNRGTDTLVLAGKVPTAGTAECADPDCVVPPGGSIVQAGTPTTSASQPLATHPVSTNGDLWFNDAATGQLYLRKDPFGTPSTVHVSASHRTDCADNPGSCSGDPLPDVPLPATFQTATPDGAHAFFTSQSELTDASNTTPPVDPPGIARADLPDAGATPPCDTEPCNVDKAHLPLVDDPPQGMTADADHLYWASPSTDSIGRSDLNGDHPDSHFIDLAPGSNPQDVVVDSGRIYWTNDFQTDANGDSYVDPGSGTIGRADLDGSGNVIDGTVNQNCITGANDPKGIDVEAGYAYWASYNGDGHGSSVGRADISTTCAAADADANSSNHQKFIGASLVSLRAHDIVVAGPYLYLAERDTVIRRYNVADGSPVGAGSGDILVSTGGATITSLASDGVHLYWTELGDQSTVGRGDLDGSGAISNIDHSFVPDLTAPVGLATGQGADSGRLYWSTGSLGGTRGNDLYRYDAGSGDLTDLSPDSADPFGADVRAVLGASADGDYVYFVANADLDGPGGQAQPGNCVGPRGGEALPATVTFHDYSGQCSIYLAHGGDISFVARLDADGSVSSLDSDAANWNSVNLLQQKLARVSANGVLLFRSHRSLTGYDNNGPNCDHRNGNGDPGPCSEFYRYDPAQGLACVSCNPTGAPPRDAPRLDDIGYNLPPSVKPSTLTRNLSADGDRVFFESSDKLVAADVNGDANCPLQPPAFSNAGGAPACQDVYMWEAEGTGSCHSDAQNGGCLYLISSGTSTQPSYFLDASTNGDDAFFFTRDRLVPSDTDDLQDVYDARVDGGLAAQHAVTPPPCDPNSGACEGQSSSPPNSPSAGSAAFSGQGNPKPHRKAHKRKHHKKKHHKKRKHHRANHNRRAGR